MQCAGSTSSLEGVNRHPPPPLPGLRELRQEPQSGKVAPEEWKDEVRSMLSETFRKQLAELREFCEEMQSGTKDAIRLFLESSTATKQEPACRSSKVEQFCTGGSKSSPSAPARRAQKQESLGWTKHPIVPVLCEAPNIPMVWNSTNSQAQPVNSKGKEADDAKRQSEVPGMLSEVATLTCPGSFPSVGPRPDADAVLDFQGGQQPKKSTRDTTRSAFSTATKNKRDTTMSAVGNMGAIASRISKKHRRTQIVSRFTRVDGKVAVSVPRTALRFSAFCKMAQALVLSPLFDYGMGALLLVNAICMGIGVNIMAVHSLAEAPARYRNLDLVFNIVFTMELFLRILAFREVFFKIDGWRWNVFDVVIVTVGWIQALPGLILETGSVMENVGIIRLLRLGRIARLIRMVRLIPELKSMVYLISASMSSFLWALVLLLMVVYCMAVYFTELACDVLQKGQAENADNVRERWGSIFQSILSLYMGITGGDDWRNFVQPFKAEPTQYVASTVIFGIYIAFATLVMLNLVTGVFVEGAQRIIREEKDFEVMNMAAKVFLATDDDESLDITFEEWMTELNAGNLDEYIKAVGITRYEATRLFDLLDLDGSGTINIAEFVRGCLRLRGPAKAMDTADMLNQMRKQNIEAIEQVKELQILVRGLLNIEAPALRKSAESSGDKDLTLCDV